MRGITLVDRSFSEVNTHIIEGLRNEVKAKQVKANHNGCEEQTVGQNQRTCLPRYESRLFTHPTC